MVNISSGASLFQTLPPSKALQVHSQDTPRVDSSSGRGFHLLSPPRTRHRQPRSDSRWSDHCRISSLHHLALVHRSCCQHHHQPLWLPLPLPTFLWEPWLSPRQVSRQWHKINVTCTLSYNCVCNIDDPYHIHSKDAYGTLCIIIPNFCTHINYSLGIVIIIRAQGCYDANYRRRW